LVERRLAMAKAAGSSPAVRLDQAATDNALRSLASRVASTVRMGRLGDLGTDLGRGGALMSEPVDLGGQFPRKGHEGEDRLEVGVGGTLLCPECGADVGEYVARWLLDNAGLRDLGDFAGQSVESLRDQCAEEPRLARHEAERIRSGGEGQGTAPVAGEPGGEHGEDGEVGVEPDAGEPTDAERKK
jgi:hypothetical protein